MQLQQGNGFKTVIQSQIRTDRTFPRTVPCLAERFYDLRI